MKPLEYVIHQPVARGALKWADGRLDVQMRTLCGVEANWGTAWAAYPEGVDCPGCVRLLAGPDVELALAIDAATNEADIVILGS